MKPKFSTSAIIAAAGQSSRMGLAAGLSKQFAAIGGKTVIERTASVFESCDYIDEIIISAREKDIAKIWEIANAAKLGKVKNIVAGGETRQKSVQNALEKVGSHIDFIAIHDGARCFVSQDDIKKVILKAYETGAAAAATKVTDTIKQIDENQNIIKTIDRAFLWAVQTPQVFSKELYLSALRNCRLHALDITDDCAIFEAADYPVSIVECSKYNIKITDMQDLDFLKGQ